jgi:hypothetical protein
MLTRTRLHAPCTQSSIADFRLLDHRFEDALDVFAVCSG